MRISLSPQEFKELLLSHHPNLPCFQEDVIILFNRRICAGCLLAYPIAFLIVLIFHPFWEVSIAIALVFALLSQLRRVINNRTICHICRFLAGIALGFGIGGGFWAIANGQWRMILLLVIGTVIYLISKAYSIKSKLMNDRIEG
jgi:hypothetical protein